MDLYDELPQSQLLYEPEFTLLLANAKRYNVSVIDLITLNASELSKLLQRSIIEVKKFHSLLVNEFDEQYKTQDTVEPLYSVGNGSDNLLKSHNGPCKCLFTAGDVNIDEILGGGIHTKGITEIFGESSTGKSQLLMQLGLTVQLPKDHGGLDGKCVFITTEGDLTTQRIQEMIESNPIFHGDNKRVSQQNIFTVSCNDLTSQEHILNVQLPILLDRHKGKIKLIIVDSISHHLRVELESKSVRNSQVNRFYIEKLAERLLHMANKYDLAVVVANQVGDKPLMENAEPIRQLTTDYDYQLGWMVGWKDSSIMYRHKHNETGGGIVTNNINPNFRPNRNSIKINSNTTKQTTSQVTLNKLDEILSDDEDSMLIEKEVHKVLEASQRSQEIFQSSPPDQANNNDNSKTHTSTSKDVVYSKEKINNRKPTVIRKKRKLDSKIPNLGLSWSNYLSTRILLKKTYKASPMIKRGELKIYKGVDESSFWQVKRTLKVVFSSFCGDKSVTYSITKRGIESTDG